MSRVIRIRVWGGRALFTQPHFRADPISYPCPTPSSMGGLMRQLYGKPEFDWEIDSITICKPIQYVTTKEMAVWKANDVERAAERRGEPPSSTPGNLRSVTFLADVEYVIAARPVVNPLRSTAPNVRYFQEALRRIKRDQQYGVPHFGVSRCVADWELLDLGDPGPEPQPLDLDIGPMLFELRPLDFKANRWLPLFFDAKVRGGVLRVPKRLYDRERPHLHRQKAFGRKRPRDSQPQGGTA